VVVSNRRVADPRSGVEARSQAHWRGRLRPTSGFVTLRAGARSVTTPGVSRRRRGLISKFGGKREAGDGLD
jgi:hypothetical protein